MPNEPVWVPIEEIISATKEAVNLSEEPFHIRDIGLLESALDSCRNSWVYGGERNTVVLGVELLLAIARNHPFLQGNKRAGFIAAMLFIESNGYVCDVVGSEELADLIVDVLEVASKKHILIDEFRRFTRRAVSVAAVKRLRS